jgi:hypothetical protein
MSKITLTLGSLIVGATLGFFCGNHTWMVVQRASAQANLAPTLGFEAPQAIPTVPGIVVHSDKSRIGPGKIQQLDGMDFKNSEFVDVTWEYSGGAFSLTNTKISAPMRVTLKGAAANTRALLAVIQAVNTGNRPKPMDPNAPVLRKTTATHTVTIDLNSPYLGVAKSDLQH